MNKQHWQDWVNVFVGIWMFISPWIIGKWLSEGSVGEALGVWDLWAVGIAVVVFAALALYAFAAWEEWVNLVLGAWLLVSPWALGYSASAAMTWNAAIAGVLLFVFAAWILVQEERQHGAAAH